MSQKLLPNLDVNTTMARAFLLIKKFNEHSLPVSSDGKTVGVISARDIEALIKNYGIDEMQGRPTFKVGNYMQSPVKRVDGGSDCSKVIFTMLNEGISAIEIEQNGKIIGAFTRDDFLEILADLLQQSSQSLVKMFNLSKIDKK